jgi:hypothetical protein
MTPPRWTTRYADDVRDALTRMIEEGEPAESAPPAHRRSHLRLVVAIVIALVLVVPASITALVLANGSAPAGGGATSSVPTDVGSAVPPTSTPTASATARPASAGCAPTTGRGIPAGADTGRIDDVDGDHRPDTEWAVLDGGAVVFGITTASGATVSGRADFAGGGERTFVVGHLANGAVVVIPGEGRDSELLTFRGCALQQAEGTNPTFPGVGKSFTIVSPNGGGDTLCLEGELYSIGYESDGGALEDVVGQRVLVSADGTKATLSPTKRTIATHLAAAALSRYQQVSCGDAPVLRPTEAP